MHGLLSVVRAQRVQEPARLAQDDGDDAIPKREGLVSDSVVSDEGLRTAWAETTRSRQAAPLAQDGEQPTGETANSGMIAWI
jgi:hypothetical protein